ncbi:dynamin family protein [Prochlorothrix hollandica]|uniref:Dynamin family protein n=1 Tax=Prochlorothrix hollandica PCC 9006 = CALU 1027 TaxID=317619 RepID=A0A0M2Q3V6_PROHO|nr:dynamin family protein [Prochlorothrix hollandica]KKJ01277.1 Dynamin family protein [Prochlorothrix hollandica PCC 9006 = CALU 1027]
MDWKTASAYYEARLSDTLNVHRHALNLAQLPQANVPDRLRQTLLNEAPHAQRQLDRLRKREFRIAIVGLEKAGKSTFLNAWLECDLLPAKAARCTFTTTQVYSVIHDSEQRLEVQAKTEEQFQQLIQDLTRANAQEDLATIRHHEQTLSQVRREGNITIAFTRLEDIRDQLKKYVADECYAHSVLEARLYTNKLAQAEGIVFYDVPGLDSGLAKHVDEAQQMLSDCDAVILVQRFTSLREKELDIIKFTEQGDKNVTIADKLFVFLSRIDSQATPQALQQHIQEAAQDWAQRTKLPSSRIIPGSAGAYLILNQLAEHQTEIEIGSLEVVQAQLQRITGISDPQTLKTIATGIPTLKDNIFEYINNERVNVLKKRCEASMSAILGAAEEIRAITSKNYPENPEDAKRFEEEKQRILFTEWWEHKWDTVRAELQDFYMTTIVSAGESGWGIVSSHNIERFQERYHQVVTAEMKNLREETARKRDVIFAANSNPVFDRTNANFRWRESLYVDVTKTLARISHQLADELQDQALNLVDYMKTLLWDSPQVKARLIENTQTYFILLENSLKVLFLRFARPVAEALIRGPVKSDTRSEIIKNIGVDIEIVDNYYQGNEPAYSVLKRYVKYGSDLLCNPETRSQVLGKNDAVQTKPDSNDPKTAVIFEVDTDLNAFEEYLNQAIFQAAGFDSYCLQELKGLVDSFRDKEGSWAGVALNEWMQGNPKLLSEVPEALRFQEVNLEVSERLRQLSTALQKASRVTE